MRIMLDINFGVGDGDDGGDGDDDSDGDDDDDDDDFAGCCGAPRSEARILEVAAESHSQQVR